MRRLSHSHMHEADSVSKVTPIKRGRPAPDLDTSTDLDDKAVIEISKALNGILADSFALYLKTKNFHWHASGPHFRSYHLLFDEQAAAIFATTTRSPSACARSAGPHCARSATSPRRSRSPTMTRRL